ncbi:MAG: hypothetical protein H7343_17845 [Undibacterium sp.]|nr:hypothetical protein [Opitutaceae bacterium]
MKISERRALVVGNGWSSDWGPRKLAGLIVVVSVISGGDVRADTPQLLEKAITQWAEGREDLAFTQHTRFLFDDGKIKEERIERYDPSQPDSRRWRLIEIDGLPATEAQREKWETTKNGKPRKKVVKPPADYLDLERALLVDETSTSARFNVGLRPEAARLLAVEKIAVVITVERESGRISRIAANLRQPIRVLLGLARITDLDIDVRIEPTGQSSPQQAGQVLTGSTARVTMSKLGYPMEYTWSDFERVASYRERD